MSLPTPVRRDLERRANVVGVGVNEDGTVLVFVTEKLPESMLASEDIVPKTVATTDAERETDVIEVGDVWALDRTARFDPAPAGVSCGHPDITAGTWGTPPLETAGGVQVILTNAHVAAPIDEANIGDTIIQPGTYDGGEPGDDDAGTLVAYTEITRDGNNYADAAIFSPDYRDTESRIIGLGRLDSLGGPRWAEAVMKSGRTTGVTSSSLVARDVSVNVGGYFPNDTARFVGVDAYEPCSAGGDSGSLIVADREEGTVGVGLLFAGSPQVTLAIPLDAVELELGTSLTPVKPDDGDGDDGDGGDDHPPETWFARLVRWLKDFLGLTGRGRR